MQDWAIETYSLRHSRAERSLAVRRMEAFLPGEGMGGAANHWNGQTWRWSEYDRILKTRLETREMEPYHDLFEGLFGSAGKAGNIKGVIQLGGNPFEGPRSREYPQRPLEITEAGRIFKAAAESLGHKPFPMPAGNSPDAYTNPNGQRLAPCQYCGHCERFPCEANAKASPQVLLYPVLLQRKGFELRLRSHVLNVNYDRQAKRVTGVRYLDLQTGQEYEQPADVVVVAAYSMTSTQLLLQDRIGTPYDPSTGKGVVGKNFCYQVMSHAPAFYKDAWINPFMAAGASQTVVDEFNGDNFDHAGLGFLGGGYIDPSRIPGVHRRVPATSSLPRRSSRSMGASSRRSTIATRTSPTLTHSGH